MPPQRQKTPTATVLRKRLTATPINLEVAEQYVTAWDSMTPAQKEREWDNIREYLKTDDWENLDVHIASWL
jgi:hypothetical protein